LVFVCGLHQSGREEWNHDLVVSGERIPLSDASDRTRDNIRLRPIEPDEVEIHRRQIVE